MRPIIVYSAWGQYLFSFTSKNYSLNTTPPEQQVSTSSELSRMYQDDSHRFGLDSGYRTVLSEGYTLSGLQDLSKLSKVVGESLGTLRGFRSPDVGKGIHLVL